MNYTNTMDDLITDTMSKITDDLVADIMFKIAKDQETVILQSLGDLVSRGLLVLETIGPKMITHDYNTNEIKFVHQCRLVLKDQEYIDKLEKENKLLKTTLDTIRASLPNNKG